MHVSQAFKQVQEISTWMMCWRIRISSIPTVYVQSRWSNEGSQFKVNSETNFQVLAPERASRNTDSVIYDVSAILWTIAWPSDKLSVYLETFEEFVYGAQQAIDVAFVFDRYYADSLKTATRMQRNRSSRVYKVTPQMAPPSRQVILCNTQNKVQLNAFITECILDKEFCLRATQKHS